MSEGTKTRQRIPIDVFTIRNPKIEAIISIVYALFFFGLAIATGLLILKYPLPVWRAANFTEDWWYLIFKIGFLLIIPLSWFYWQGYKLKDIIPNYQVTRLKALQLVILFVLGIFINLINFERMDQIQNNFGNFPLNEAILRLFVAILIPLVAAAIPEELFFRGFMQPRLEKVSHRSIAIIVPALLFTLWHLPTRFLLASGSEGTHGDLGSVLMGTGVPVLIIGLIFGVVYDRSRNIYGLIILHWGIDIIPSIESFFGIVN